MMATRVEVSVVNQLNNHHSNLHRHEQQQHQPHEDSHHSSVENDNLFKDNSSNHSDTEADLFEAGDLQDKTDTLILKPGPHDVLLGRGGGTNNHCGNIKFRQLVNQKKLKYLSCSKVEKPKVAREVVQMWRKLDPPGRFLARKDETKKGPGSVKALDNVWYEVGDKKAREKASQCLRERTPEVMPYIQQLREQQDAATEHGVSMVQQQMQMHQQALQQQQQEGYHGGGHTSRSELAMMRNTSERGSGACAPGAGVFMRRNSTPMAPPQAASSHSHSLHSQGRHLSPLESRPHTSAYGGADMMMPGTAGAQLQQQQLYGQQSSYSPHEQHATYSTVGSQISPHSGRGMAMMQQHHHPGVRRTSMPLVGQGPPAPFAISRRGSMPAAPQLSMADAAYSHSYVQQQQQQPSSHFRGGSVSAGAMNMSRQNMGGYGMNQLSNQDLLGNLEEELYAQQMAVNAADMTDLEYRQHMQLMEQQLAVQQMQMQRMEQQRAMQRAHGRVAVSGNGPAVSSMVASQQQPQAVSSQPLLNNRRDPNGFVPQHARRQPGFAPRTGPEVSDHHDDEPLPLDLGDSSHMPLPMHSQLEKQQPLLQQQNKRAVEATEPLPVAATAASLKQTLPARGGLKRSSPPEVSPSHSGAESALPVNAKPDVQPSNRGSAQAAALPASSAAPSSGPVGLRGGFNEAAGELTLEEYRQHLEEYMTTMQIPQHSEIRLDDADADYASDLEDDWEKEKEKAYVQQQKKQTQTKRGVNRNQSGCSLMSTRTFKSTGMSLVSGMTGLSDLMSVGETSAGGMSRGENGRLNMGRSISSNISLMSELTDLSQNLDNISLYDD